MPIATQALADCVEASTPCADRAASYNGLDALPESYAPLFAENGDKSFFLSRPWFQNLSATALDPGERPRIIAAERGGTPVAAVLARCRRPSVWQASPRILYSLTNFYSSFYAPLFSSQHDPARAADSLARAIRADKPAWDAVDLKWLDSESVCFSEMQRAFRATGMVVQTYFSAGNWYLPTNGMSFREYSDNLRSSVRNIAKSKNKKIERSGRARLEIVTGGSGLETAIEFYNRVYASSWKVAEPYPAFIPGLIRTCAAQGWLRLGLLRIDDEPAAVQLWIVNNKKAAIYKIAYDKRFADLSVGSYLTTHLMEYALDVDRVTEVDYLTGDDKYKKDWMTHRRELWGILAMDPRTLRGAAAIARHVGGRAVKRALQAIRPHLRKSTDGPVANGSHSGK